MSDPNKAKRTAAKSGLTRFANYFNNIKTQENINLLDLHSRLEKAEELFKTFEEAQSLIEIADLNLEENYETIHSHERQLFEDQYFKITSDVKQFLDNKTVIQGCETNSTQGVKPAENADSLNSSSVQVQLPPLNLPTFNGSFDQWLFFRDSFVSIIHENTKLPDIQKFHYLRLSLEGSAAEMIKSLQTSADNYNVAWQLLTERFENKPLLVHNHIKELFSLPTITKESKDSLRQLLDGCQRHLRSLNILGCPTEHWADLVVYLISNKFDNTTRRAWESRNCSNTLHTMDDLLDFLKERCRILETMTSSDTPPTRQPSKPFQHANKPKTFLVSTNDIKCLHCQKAHSIYTCTDFLKLSSFDRLNTAKRLRLCINCLSNTHNTKSCRSSGCRRCGKIHHTLLHFETSDRSTDNNVHQQTSKQSAPLEQPTNLVGHINTGLENQTSCQALLSTALVQVLDKHGSYHPCRVLLDSGSQSNFITEQFANRLHLDRHSTTLIISGVTGMTNNVNSLVNITFKSFVNNFQHKLVCLIVPKITGQIPSLPVSRSSLLIPRNIHLADPDFDQPASVDLLIGADIFWDLLCIGQIKLGTSYPILQKTKLGWIISGPIPINSHCNFSQCHFSTETALERQLSKFWELEDCPKTKFLSQEENFCEEHFKQNTFLGENGHFTVSLPLKHSPSVLGESKQTAIKRLLNTEKKLSNNSDLQKQYHDFLQEYIDLGHMSLVDTDLDNEPTFYLPHHCVLKDSSTTTKLRVVFDGSAKSSTGYSVNDIMMVGSNIQHDLFSILIRFRKHNYVLSADIAKMYRQVYIKENQRQLQRILWRFSPKDKISVYNLNTVTYGTACASFLATRALHEVAYLHVNDCPKLASIILDDFYVDDLLTGCNAIEQLNEIKSSITELLQRYGFTLRKWSSNCPTVSDNDTSHFEFAADVQSKTLGLLWNRHTDTLQYSVNMPLSPTRITKRQILSYTSQIFDPLGLLSPVTITSKIIMQELWKLKLSWDESVPANLHTVWSTYKFQLTKLNDIKFSRHVLSKNPSNIQLHGFCDASQAAYGACIYIRCIDSSGLISSNLLCSKTRVAPLKVVSIPRLELCGALLLAELVSKILSICGIDFDTISLWSDSTITLSWINTSPHLLKTFVANRVSQIQSFTQPNNWHYVKTDENPADLLSRGLTPTEIMNSKLWFHGPDWLTKLETFWAPHDIKIKQLNLTDIPELNIKHQVFHIDQVVHFDISKYSSLSKLKRVLGYIFRFKNNSSKSKEFRQYGPLTTQELSCAFFHLIKIVQIECFPEEYSSLSNNLTVSKRSRLLSLSPFFDKENDLIRVGGRLRHSTYDFQKKFPIILPPKHHLTQLIVQQEHSRLMHAGPQALLASIRERFWPLSGRMLVRKVVHNCVKCFRANPILQQHKMGDLPSSRVMPCRPFLIAGVDYAGPFLLRDRKTRKYQTTKAYIALFVCFTTKAVHIEIVSELTTECFLAALRRFMSRRGKCSEIFSDNGTTFVGADNEIKRFISSNDKTISENLSNDGIKWNFIVPRAPHFGGLWESGVKSVKFHLKRVIGNAALTFEDFYTVLCQIEACLNSRPLYPLSSDPNDPTPLTPGHMLIGEPLTTIPEPNLLLVKENYLSRFQRLQQLLQHFWARWTKEYISHLQQRVKWKENHPQLLHPGALVIVKEDGLPPLKWKLGRITEIHPGSDNIVRSVTIRTSGSDIKRPVVKVCVLPMPNQD